MTYEYILKTCNFLDLDCETTSKFISTKDLVVNDPFLFAKANELLIDLFVEMDDFKINNILTYFPLYEDKLDEYKFMFPALIFLGGIQMALEHYEHKSIDISIAKETFSDFNIWLMDNKTKTGFYGLSELKWLYKHLTLRIFRLGRLQFEPIDLKTFDYFVYQDIKSKKLYTFHKGGKSFRADGNINGNNGIFDIESSFISVFKKTNDYIIGNLVNTRQGTLETSITKLKNSNLELILSGNDKALNVHIASGHPLTPIEVQKSYNLANVFFKEDKFKAFVCFSWLLDTSLLKIIDNNSNILSFQKNFMLFPSLTRTPQIYSRIFGSNFVPKETSQNSSSLERGIIENYKKGMIFKNGAGFKLI